MFELANVRVIHENRDPIYIELTFIKCQSQQKSSAFVICLNFFESSLTNNVDPDQTGPVDLGPHCLLTNKKTFSDEDILLAF